MTAVRLETAARAIALLRTAVTHQNRDMVAVLLPQDEAKALLHLVESIIPSGAE